MEYPPHLPPPACSVPFHERTRAVQLIFAVALVSLVAGFAGGAVLLTWVWPRVVGDSTTFLSNQQNNTHAVLTDKTERELADLIMPVYRKSDSSGSDSQVLLSKDKVGDAVITSSDGWLAVSSFDASGLTGGSVISNNGKVLPIDKVIADKEAGIIYLKIAAPDQTTNQSGQFKIISFANNVKAGDEVFVLNRGVWQTTVLANRLENSIDAPHLDTVAVHSLSLTTDAPAGSLVVTTDGELAGFVGANESLAPADLVARIVPNVLSTGNVIYPTLGVDGWFNEEVPVIVNGSRAEGLLVAKVRNGTTKLRRGDVVTLINGVPASPSVWWSAIQGAKEVNAQVWRAGKLLDFNLTVGTLVK